MSDQQARLGAVSGFRVQGSGFRSRSRVLATVQTQVETKRPRKVESAVASSYFRPPHAIRNQLSSQEPTLGSLRPPRSFFSLLPRRIQEQMKK